MSTATTPTPEQPPEPKQPPTRPTTSHHAWAIEYLDLAFGAPHPEDATAFALNAAAHAALLQATEQRIASWIAYLGVLTAVRDSAGLSGQGAGITPDGLAKIREIEARIDAALGLDR